MNNGWICLHRKLKDHWIWKSENRLKWWIDILLTVNFIDNKVLIGNTLLDCKRGQSLRSLESWAKSWDVSKKTVRDFFILLQKDNMIEFENVIISTRITVCNYDSYNVIVNDKETDSKRQVNDKETDSKRQLPTNNNTTNEQLNNVNNFNDLQNNLQPQPKITPQKPILNDIDQIYNSYPTKCIIQNRSLGKTIKNKEQIKKLLNTKNKEQIIKIINEYISDCKKNNIYMKNFTTFLNNLPDDQPQIIIQKQKIDKEALRKEHSILIKKLDTIHSFTPERAELSKKINDIEKLLKS